MPRRLAEAEDGVESVVGSVCKDHMHMCLRIVPKHSVARETGCLAVLLDGVEHDALAARARRRGDDGGELPVFRLLRSLCVRDGAEMYERMITSWECERG